MPKPIGAHLTRIYESLDHLLSAAGRGDMTNVRAWGREIRSATEAITENTLGTAGWSELVDREQINTTPESTSLTHPENDRREVNESEFFEGD